MGWSLPGSVRWDLVLLKVESLPRGRAASEWTLPPFTGKEHVWIYIYIHRCHPQIHYHFGFRSTIKLHNTATVCLKTSGMRLFVSLENIPYQDKPWGFGGFFWLVKKVRVIELMNQPGCFLRSPCESALLLNLLSSLKFLYPRKMNPITTIPHETNDLTLIDTL